MTPNFRNYIMVSPKSRVIRPSKDRFNTSMIIKADTLFTTIDKYVDNMDDLSVFATASKITSFETVKEAALRLAALHKPIKIDYLKRFGIEDKLLDKQIITTAAQQSKRLFCFKCKITISERVAKFCWDNKSRFGGRAYCIDCQKSI